MRYSRSTSWARAVFACAGARRSTQRVAAAFEREDLARPAADHRLDVERSVVAELLVEEGGERVDAGVGHGSAGAEARPAAARSSAHFSTAAGRRLGMCSVGQPSTGR